MSPRVGALALLALAASCADEPARSLVVITLDTTRADALGRGVSPRIDELAREGVTYAQARTVAPLTMPSHASMFTGLYPPRHRVRDNNIQALPASASTLAERAREAGLETAAFVSAIAVDRAFGLDQGFDVYDQPERPRANVTSHFGERVGRETAALAVEWIEGRDPERPFLLWVHLFDPHAPYEPAPARLRAADGDAYLGEVAALDAAVGDVLVALRGTGALERALVIVVGDHGESLGEHGEDTHGAFCFDATMRVPFVLRHPDLTRAGERSNALVSVVDVFPTGLDWLGLGAAGDVDGTSLLRADPDPARGVYFESYYGWITHAWSPLAGWADREGALLWSSEPRFVAAGGAPEGVPVEADAWREHRRALAEVHARAVLPDSSTDRVDEELLAGLRGLGYGAVGRADEGWPSPFEASELPSPHARTEELARTHEAMLLADRGEHALAVPILREVLADNPASRIALDRLGNSLVLSNRFAEAIEPLRRLVADGPPWAGSRYNLGVALFQTGAPEEALTWFEAALTADPGHVQSLDALAKVHASLGHADEAERWRARLEEAR